MRKCFMMMMMMMIATAYLDDSRPQAHGARCAVVLLGLFFVVETTLHFGFVNPCGRGVPLWDSRLKLGSLMTSRRRSRGLQLSSLPI